MIRCNTEMIQKSLFPIALSDGWRYTRLAVLPPDCSNPWALYNCSHRLSEGTRGVGPTKVLMNTTLREGGVATANIWRLESRI